MRTSLNKIKEIDDHLNGMTLTGDALIFEARMIIDPVLQADVAWHKQTISLVQQYGRTHLRNEIEAVHNQLFSHPRHRVFKNRILRFFKH